MGKARISHHNVSPRYLKVLCDAFEMSAILALLRILLIPYSMLCIYITIDVVLDYNLT